MTTITTTDRSAARSRIMLVAAATTTAVALAAGALLLAIDPGDRSTTEGALGLTAAIAGLSTAGLLITASIHASATGLWQRLPIRARYLSWGALTIIVIHNLWTQIRHIT